MGIKLDWEIETERTSAQGIGEMPVDVRRRRAAIRQALLAIGLIAGLILGVVGIVAWRLRTVESTIEQQLRDVVTAEVTALRIGDIAGYLYIQRSESDAWMLGQTDLYWNYQQLKLQHSVELTGNIVGLAIDESRARVVVEEIIDGQRYGMLWFYWRYADGWRHVPMDVEFWGDASRLSGQNYSVGYHDLDEATAQALASSLEQLWGQGCVWLACPTPLPNLTARILPDPAVGVSWSPDVDNVMLIASPLTARFRLGVPIEPDAQRQIAALLAQRVLAQAAGSTSPQPEADAAFLYGAIEDWLVGRFMGDGAALGSTFIESLAQSYGEQAVGALVRSLHPDSSIAALSAAMSAPLDTLAVDWREFFQWRLALEPYLLAQGNQQALLNLYDESALTEAYALISDPAATSRAAPTVLRVNIGPGSDGVTRAWVMVQVAGGGEVGVTFRLVDGVWRRSALDAAAVAP